MPTNYGMLGMAALIGSRLGGGKKIGKPARNRNKNKTARKSRKKNRK